MIPTNAPQWAGELSRRLDALERSAGLLPIRSISNMPKATPAGQIVVVPDATAGRVLAVSDGAAWIEFQPVGVLS